MQHFRLIHPRTTASARRQKPGIYTLTTLQKHKNMARTLVPWSWLRFGRVIHARGNNKRSSRSEC